MMAAAAVDMNQKIISMNLNIMEEQRGIMHHTVDQYVDKVIDAGTRWITRRERHHSTFLEIQTITSKAMAFLSLKCNDMKSEIGSETSDLIGRNEFTQQQKNTQMDSAEKSVTAHGNWKEYDTDDVKITHTCINPSDQETRYQDVYNKLRSVLAKQDKLEQQLNMKINNLTEDTESLKLNVGSSNEYLETGKSLLKEYSQKLESLENTVSCLSGNVNEMFADQKVLADRIYSHLSVNDDQVITDLSVKVDQISTDLTDKVEQVKKDLSAKIDQVSKDLSADVAQINIHRSADVAQINTDLSAKVAQINTDLLAKIAQINKDLSARVAHINTYLSDIVNETNLDLAQISTDLAQISTYLSDKVNQTNTDLSAKVDQINVVLQSLTNSEKEHAAQINKPTDLEKQLNTIEKDTQNNDKHVQQWLDEVGENLLEMTQKLRHRSTTVATTCAKMRGLHYSKAELLLLSKSMLSHKPPPMWHEISDTHADCCIPANKVRGYFDPSAFHYHDGSLAVSMPPWM